MPPRLVRKNASIHRFVQDGALHHRNESTQPIMKRFLSLTLAISILTACPAVTEAGPLKVHGIFASNMVLQRDKPIVVWGWAEPGKSVSVLLGNEKAEGKAAGDKGRWEVTFPARGASSDPQAMVVTTGNEKVEMANIVVGDVWVMTGQSNMAFGLGKTQHSDIEIAQSNLPLLRFFSIDPNEQSSPQDDIPAEKISTKGWAVSGPETSPDFSAIGYIFGARLQRSLGIPIGLIKSARGGASIEAIVPSHKFDDHPLAKRYADSVKKKIAAFDREATSLQVWNNQLARAKGKGLPEDKWPKKPVNGDNLTSWNIPGMSASDMGSIHHGMFGVFKGYHIKGVLFHQGFNNAMMQACRPQRYRVLMKLMVEGWRDDFKDPALPVGVIGFCAGGNTQNEDNFEAESFAGAPFIREAQRLGLADVGDPVNTAFLPAYDVKVPGLHPSKKRDHGERAARWALAKIYAQKGMRWETASLVSAEPQGDEMILTFSQKVSPDDMNSIPSGFSIAGEDGKLYMAHARYRSTQDGSRWKIYPTIIHVWSPLVKKPVAVRYGWASSPLGNLKIAGQEALPFPSFRTDTWDWPESEDPEVGMVDRAKERAIKGEAEARCDHRRTEEAKRGVEILERIKVLGQTKK
jgi:sialate O-acetylesterase